MALAGAVAFVVHHAVVKSNLFLVSGLVHRLRGSYELRYLGGLHKLYPWLGILFLVPALSLAGLPPFSGFFSKLFLIRACLEVGSDPIVAAALCVSMLTLYSMIKIWTKAFWKTDPGEVDFVDNSAQENMPGHLFFMVGPIVALGALAIGLGFGAEYFYGVCLETAEQLLDTSHYVNAVLGRVS